MSDLTIEKLMEAKKLVDNVISNQEEMLGIVFSDMAKKKDGYYFKPSKHRSNRIHKKLLKRYGSQDKYVPAILKMDGYIYAPTSLRGQLMKECNHNTQTEDAYRRGIMSMGGIPVYDGAPPLRLGKLMMSRQMVYEYTS